MTEINIRGVMWQSLDKRIDERGELTELYRTDWVGARPAMVYISLTLPGVVRGPHEHQRQTDIMAFPGPSRFKLRLADNRTNSPSYGMEHSVFVGGDNPSVWVFPPGVIHAYQNVGTVTATCINAPDSLYAGPYRQEPVDEIRHEDEGLTMDSERWVKP